MKPMTLTLKGHQAQRVDVAPLTPDLLQGKSRSEIARIPLHAGNRNIPTGDLFAIDGADTSDLHLRGDCRTLNNIGAGMGGGSITVHGSAGHRLGAAMRGGQVSVHGDAGDWVGTGMHGGRIEIRGHAGNWVGAGFPGDTYGMNGGTILISGSAGERIGDRMRRGSIIIKGDTGAYCGTRMLAGTILVLGTTGEFAGLGMKRGTLILGRRPKQIVATFNASGTLKMQFLRILFRQWMRTYPNLTELRKRGPLCEYFSGDLTTGGKGELMILRNAYL
jgi:formylmethanofuran dehydrogenase subunit C